MYRLQHLGVVCRDHDLVATLLNVSGACCKTRVQGCARAKT